MIKKLIIAGGRDFFNRYTMHKAISVLAENGVLDPKCEVVSGMAKGADLVAHELYKCKTENQFFADWKNLDVPRCRVKTNGFGQYNALAGMNRNQKMSEHADGLVAFWDEKSSGTKNMIKIMTKLNKPVYVFDYRGEAISASFGSKECEAIY